MTRVAVVDYRMGNVDSVVRAVQECGGDPLLTADHDDFRRAGRIILPGVGSFADGMRRIRESGLEEILLEQVIGERIPILGLCLGMHLLGTFGEEGGGSSGLGLIMGRVVKLQPDVPRVRVPHVGWNEVHPQRESPLVEGIHSGADFYFVHSYHFVCDDTADIVATTPYCGSFTSIVRRDNVAGAQFHPEKSQRNGFLFLRNFLGWDGP